MKVFFIFAFLITYHLPLTTVLQAGTATTSANFLQENVSARQVGMGGIFTATAEDSYSMLSNPAGLARMARPEMSFSYLSSHDNSRHGFAGYAHPLQSVPSLNVGIGAALFYYSAGKMDINDLDGTARSLNAETGYSGTISLATRIKKWVALGISPKFVRSTLVEQFSANAFAVDIGAILFPFPIGLKERIALGVAVQNLGSKMTYRTVQHDLPRTDSAGIAVRFWDHEEYGAILGSVQSERTAGEKLRYRMGGEYSFGGKTNERVFSLRGGYRMHFESEDYSVGIGFREKNFQLDYAFTNGIDLEKTHRFTLTVQFGKFAKQKETLRFELLDFNKELEKKEKYELIEETEPAHK